MRTSQFSGDSPCLPSARPLAWLCVGAAGVWAALSTGSRLALGGRQELLPSPGLQGKRQALLFLLLPASASDPQVGFGRRAASLSIVSPAFSGSCHVFLIMQCLPLQQRFSSCGLCFWWSRNPWGHCRTCPLGASRLTSCISITEAGPKSVFSDELCVRALCTLKFGDVSFSGNLILFLE